MYSLQLDLHSQPHWRRMWRINLSRTLQIFCVSHPSGLKLPDFSCHHREHCFLRFLSHSFLDFLSDSSWDWQWSLFYSYSIFYFPIFFITVSQKGDRRTAARRNNLGMSQILVWLWKINQQESTHYSISCGVCWYTGKGPRTQLYIFLCNIITFSQKKFPPQQEERAKGFAPCGGHRIPPPLRLVGQRLPLPTGTPPESTTPTPLKSNGIRIFLLCSEEGKGQEFLRFWYFLSLKENRRTMAQSNWFYWKSK